MSARAVILNSAFLLPFLAASSARAQGVAADIRIGGGPMAGQLIIGSPWDRYDPGGDYGYRPRPVRVEVIGRQGRGWFGRFRRDARVVVVYYDRYRPGLREIQVYQRDGRFYRSDGGRDDYRYDDDNYSRDRDHHRNRDYDRNRDDNRDDH